jgi:regulator of replication initiation timing
MLAPDQITRNTRRLIDDRADNSPTYSRQEALDRAQGLHSSIESLRKDLRYTHDAKMALLRQNEELHMENERLKADLRTNRHENREFERRANYHLEEGNRTINDLQQRLSRGDELLLAQKREHATLVHATEGKQRSDQQQIDALVKEREQAISNRLKMDAFDSSVDRVSEAQLVSNMESIMSSVDDFVSVLVEEASNISPGSSKNTPILDEDASLLIQPVIHCTPGTEGWNLLLDALIHEVIIERLYSTLFSTALATPISGHIETRGRILEDLHGHIEETGSFILFLHEPSLNSDVENWRAAQRWRSMTAKANSKLMRDSDWLPFINAASLSIRQHLAYAVHQPIEATDSLVSFIDPHITTIFNEARNLCFSATQDMVSVRIIPVLGSDEEIAQEYLWPDMGILDSDQVVSDYSLGLIKVDEAQKRTVLMHSKVASHALIRYAVKSLRRE